MVSLLFSFSGRINRKQYWIGTGLVTMLSVMGQMLAFSSSVMLPSYKDSSAAIASALGASAFSIPINLLVLWCTLAIQFKRFHDRGRTGWLSMIPLVLVVLAIGSIVGNAFAGAPIEKLFADLLPLVVLMMITGLAFFIDLGCMQGVEGPNKYGPPPGTPPASLNPSRPSGAVDAASSLFGAQSAMDRAIAEKAAPVAQRPAPAMQSAYAAAAPMRAPAQPAPAGFGRRVTR
jgi:uncharacterized membrane protein YhaH (DUF805 family)